MNEDQPNQSNKKDTTEKKQFCTFRLADRLFGVDILDVKEINPEIVFTPIFHAPKVVKGYVNIRGQIHLVIDMRLVLGYEPKAEDAMSRIVLFKQEVGPAFGVLVDCVGDVVTIEKNQIEDSRHMGQKSKNHLQDVKKEITIGVCKLKNELLVILNAKKILATVNPKTINNE